MIDFDKEMAAAAPIEEIVAFGFFDDEFPQIVSVEDARSEVLEPLTLSDLINVANKMSEHLTRQKRALTLAEGDQIDLLHACRKYQAETNDFRLKELRIIRADAVENRLKITREALSNDG